MKTCTKCKVEKALTDFSVNRSRKDGYQLACKACQSEAARTRRQAPKAPKKAPEPKPKPPVFAKLPEPPPYRFHPVEPDKQCMECKRDLPGMEFSYKSYACHQCTHQVWLDTMKARVHRTRMGMNNLD